MEVKDIGIGSITGMLEYVAMSVGNGNLEGFESCDQVYVRVVLMRLKAVKSK